MGLIVACDRARRHGDRRDRLPASRSLIFTVSLALLRRSSSACSGGGTRRLLGGVALIATLLSLIVTDLVSDGFSIDGSSTWLAAAVIVWARALVAAVPAAVLRAQEVPRDARRRPLTAADRLGGVAPRLRLDERPFRVEPDGRTPRRGGGVAGGRAADPRAVPRAARGGDGVGEGGRLDARAAKSIVRELKAVGGNLRAVRRALTGRESGPELWSVIAALPREETLRRIDGAL